MDGVTHSVLKRAVELGLATQFSSADSSSVETLTSVLEQVVIRAGKRARIIAESANRSEILAQDIEAAIAEWERYTGSVDVLPEVSSLRSTQQLSCEVSSISLPQFTSSLVNSANLKKTPVSLFPAWLVKDVEGASKAAQPSLVSPVPPPPAGLAEEEARGILAAKKMQVAPQTQH